MKRICLILLFIAVLTPLAFLPAAKVSRAAESYITENDAVLADFSVVSGDAQTALKRDNPPGVQISSDGSFTLKYAKEFSFTGFSCAFYVDTSDGIPGVVTIALENLSGNGILSVVFGFDADGDKLLSEFNIESPQGVLFGSPALAFAKYADGVFLIEIKIECSKVLQFDGSLVDIWAVACGGKEDGALAFYNKQFGGASYTAVSDYLFSLRDKPYKLALKGGAGELILKQINEKCFYDYKVFSGGYAGTEDDVMYSDVRFKWKLQPSEDTDGTIVKCTNFSDGNVVSQTIVTNVSQDTLLYTKFKQGAVYRYDITGVKGIKSSVIPTVVYKYEPIDITTRQGTIGVFLAVCISIAAALIAAVLIFVFWPDIIDKFAKKKRTND